MAKQSDYVIETEGLSKSFGEQIAVDGVDLRVPRGSAFGYLGPNGAGKTTLIRILLGLTQPNAGTMRVLGRPMPKERSRALARVGAIVEEPGFHKHLSGRENLWISAAAREPRAHMRIDSVLEQVGLTDRADDRVSTYSQGMRQRLGIARCLLADPEVLILDEPTNGLDPGGIQEFRGLVRSWIAEGRTLVLSSHLLDEVEKICDHVAIVDRGRIVAQGSLAELSAGDDGAITIGCDKPRKALSAIDGNGSLLEVEEIAGGLRVLLRPDEPLEKVAAELNKRLVGAGIAVHRLEPSHVSLEHRFLEITRRFGEDS
ncbi:MAG: ABC transporter ATP-binding protein [Gaiellaceae bacterium]